jgi:ubiquinone/menaquinone biosynthesis C-methylase UbiE
LALRKIRFYLFLPCYPCAIKRQAIKKMDIKDATALLQSDKINFNGKKMWADLGCGSGTFTKALAHLLQPKNVIHAMDTNQSAVNKIPGLYYQIVIQKWLGDFENNQLPFNNLDGILMANAMHYVKDKAAFIKKLQPYLNENHCFIMVEYDIDTPVKTWVPYPLSFKALQKLFTNLGYTSIYKLHERPSIFGRGNIYSAFISK